MTGDRAVVARGLEVFVLGPLLAQYDGRPVELGPLRRRATLAALVMDANRVVAQDTLIDRVWDGAPTGSAVTAVQAYLSRLRSSMKRAGAGDASRSPIVTEQPGYRLAVRPENLDAHRFAEALATARGTRDGGDVHEASRQVRAGLALWRGTAYADIPTRAAGAEAERLAGTRRDAQELAVELDLALGRHHEVLDELRELVATWPLDERLHGLQMLALHRAGRPAEALEHFARLRVALGEQLGVDPGRELQELHARLLRADAALDLPSTPVVVAPGPAVPTVARPGPSSLDTTADAPRLIGRASEAAALRAALDATVTGGVRAVGVVGEAGIGKTRLLEDGAAHARAGGAVVAWGRSWQHDGAPRMWPFVQALRSLAEQVGPAAFDGAFRPHAAALAAIVPDLAGDHTTGTGAPAAPDLEHSELRTVDAVARVLEALAARQRLVVVLEDLHWADVTTRRTVEYLVTQPAAAGFALLVSVRWPGDEPSAATGSLLAGLTRGAHVTRIDLTGFDADDVREYVADRTGSVIDDATSAALVDRTDGNPFFVGEIVRLVVTDDGVTADRASAARVPDSVRAVVLARLEQLDPAVRAVLDAAAVIGRSFDLDLLVAASGEHDDTVDEAVDRATAAGVVATEPGHPGVHRFAHALVQQTLLDDIGPSRRRRVHARVAAELARREYAPGVPRDPDQLVHHLAGAGGDADLVQAVGICVARADTARGRGDLAAAEAVLLQAVDLAARLRGPDAPLTEMSARLRLYSLYALDAPSSDVATSHRDRAVQLARQYGRPADLLVALQAAYAGAIMRFDLPAMLAVEEEQQVAAEAMADDALRVGALMCRVQRLTYTGRLVEVLTVVEELTALLDRVKVPVGAFPIHPARNVRLFRALVLTMLGRDAESAAQVTELDTIVEGRDPHTVTYINLLVAILQAARGDVESAGLAVGRTREAQAVAGTTDGALYIDVVEAWVAARRTPGTGADDIAAALAPWTHLPGLGMRPFLRGLHADALLLAGRSGEAVEAVGLGLAEVDRTHETLAEAWLARIGVAAATRAGAPDLAALWQARSESAAADQARTTGR